MILPDFRQIEQAYCQDDLKRQLNGQVIMKIEQPEKFIVMTEQFPEIGNGRPIWKREYTSRTDITPAASRLRIPRFRSYFPVRARMSGS